MAISDADILIEALSAEGFKSELSEKAIRAAVQEARTLARWPIDEIAALFFAFARRPRAVPSLNAKLAIFFAREQAANLGVALDASNEDLRGLLTPIRARELTFPEVQQWFAERIPAS